MWKSGYFLRIERAWSTVSTEREAWIGLFLRGRLYPENTMNESENASCREKRMS